MPLTEITVVYGTGGQAGLGSTPSRGVIKLQPIQETPDSDVTIIADAVTLPVINGVIDPAHCTIYTNGQPGLQVRVTEIIGDADNPAPYIVAVPTSGTLDLSQAPRGTVGAATPLYVPVSLISTRGDLLVGTGPGAITRLGVGVDGSVLTADSTQPGGMRWTGGPAWRYAEVYAGLSNPSLLTPYSGNDPNSAITLASGIYQNLAFVCSELIIPNDNTKVVNCSITTTNSSYGVRLDANTGEEVGRYLEHCTITAVGVALAGAGFTARLCEVVNNCDDSARIGRSHAEPTVLELCHFHSFRPQAGAHADGVQIVTPPAADVVINGCSITMDTAAGYTVPPATGYTGALFVDTSDVPISGGDPEPSRLGGIWAIGSKFWSPNGNYSIVIDGAGTDITDCVLLPGTTAVESIQAGITVTGSGNVDVSGSPIIDTDIHGDTRSEFLRVGDPRQAGASTTFASLTDVSLTSLADGQVPTWIAADSRWENRTPSGGGGGAGQAMSIVSGQIVSGNVPATNTSGAFLPIAGTSVSISAVQGDQVTALFGFTDSSAASTYYDIGVTVNGTLVRQLYCPTFPAPSSYEGMPGALPDSPGTFFGPNAPRWFTVGPGDLDTGSVVTFCLCRRSTGSGSLLMSPDIPVTYSLYNNHH